MVFGRKPETKPAGSPEVAPSPAVGAVRSERTAPSGPAGDAELESIIGNDLAIEGQSITIRCQGSLRVNGNIQADLHGKRIVVGEEAVIRGSIAAEEVVVLGQVNGEILGASVVLHASADVEGDIHSQHLALERGASFNGRSRRVTDPSEVAPQLVASAPSPRPHFVSGGASQPREVAPLAAGTGMMMPPSRAAF